MLQRHCACFFLIIAIALPAHAALFGKGKGAKKDPCAGAGWGTFGREVPTAARRETPLRPFEMHYEIHGSENPETLVLIHGLDSSGRTFDPVVKELAKKYRVIVVDQRGHGKSEARGTDYSSEVMARDLEGLLDYLGVETCHILGHSMGGRTAVRFAEMFPDRVDSVIIEDMEMKQRADTVTPTDQAKMEKDSEKLKKIFANPIYPSREKLVAALAKVYGPEAALEIAEKRAEDQPDGTCRLMYRPWITGLYGRQGNAEDLTPALKAIKAPVLLIRADPREGTAVSSGGARAFGYAAPTAQTKIINGAGHSVHKDKPIEFVDTVSNFLSGAAPVKIPEPKLDAAALKTIHGELHARSANPQIASEGTLYTRKGAAVGVVPRGSAVITDSGALKEKGITQIIHAAPGSMFRSEPEFIPAESGVDLAVRNSMALAKANGHHRVAVPFIGGNIFLSRIGIPPEQLATTIVKAALETRGDMEIRFVMFKPEELEVFDKVLKKLLPPGTPPGAVQVQQGSITDAKLHGATAIVNAANIELTFGAGLSGAIGDATANRRGIDEEAAKAIAKFNGDLLPILDKWK